MNTIIKLHPNPTLDRYEVIHAGGTVGYYWVMFVAGKTMFRAVDRGAKSLGDHVTQDAAVAAIINAAIQCA